MNRILILGVVALGLLAAGRVQAQSSADELYGRGVHAYNAYNYKEAHEQFTAAIGLGSRDPRVLYFRGLSFAKMGRPEQAAADFRAAADLELKKDAKVVDVGKALERVQGSQRLEIEKYRREARAAAAKTSVTTSTTRYEPPQSNQERVVRQPMPASAPPIAIGAAPTATGDNDPFKNGVGVGNAEKAPDRVAAAPPPVAKTSDPFGPPAVATPIAPDPKTVAKTDNPPVEVDPFGSPTVGGNTSTPMPATEASAADVAAENTQTARSLGMAIGSIFKGPGITIGPPRMVPGPPRPGSPFGGTPMPPTRVNPMPPPAPRPMPPAGVRPVVPAPRPMPPLEDDPFAPAKPEQP